MANSGDRNLSLLDTHRNQGGCRVRAAMHGVRSLIRNWLPGLNETANYVLPIPLKTTPECPARIRKRDRDRAERIRLAGGRMPTLRERAVALAIKKGEVRTKDLADIGVSAATLPACSRKACSSRRPMGATVRRFPKRLDVTIQTILVDA